MHGELRTVHYGIESGAEKALRGPRASKSLSIPWLYANIEWKMPGNNKSPLKEEEEMQTGYKCSFRDILCPKFAMPQSSGVVALPAAQSADLML